MIYLVELPSIGGKMEHLEIWENFCKFQEVSDPRWSFKSQNQSFIMNILIDKQFIIQKTLLFYFFFISRTSWIDNSLIWFSINFIWIYFLIILGCLEAWLKVCEHFLMSIDTWYLIFIWRIQKLYNFDLISDAAKIHHCPRCTILTKHKTFIKCRKIHNILRIVITLDQFYNSTCS